MVVIVIKNHCNGEYQEENTTMFERKQKLCAQKKEMLEDTKTINDVLHDTPLSHNTYPQGIAKASWPHRAFKEKNCLEPEVLDFRVGQKQKHAERTLASCVCWQEHHLWLQILHAINVVGHPWSLTDILKQLQSTNATAFGSLIT